MGDNARVGGRPPTLNREDSHPATIIALTDTITAFTTPPEHKALTR